MTSDALTGIIAEYVGGIVDAKLAALPVSSPDPALVGLPEQVAALTRAVEELRAHAVEDQATLGQVAAQASDLTNRLHDLIEQVETLPTAQPADRTGATTLTIASADCSPAEKAAADYVCDGIADQEQINDAINRLAPLDDRAVKHGTQGGGVKLLGARFVVSGPILTNTLITVEGQGRHTTVQAAPSFQGGERVGIFELVHPDAQYVTVQNLTIHGNAWAGANVCGVYFSTGAGTQWDACHQLRDLYIVSTGWHGVYLTHPSGATRDRGHYIDNVRVIDAGVDRNPASGLVLDSTDCTVVGVDVGSAGGDGIRIKGANNRIVGSKGWFSGGYGWNLTGSARNALIGCEAQDNRSDGFLVGGIHNQLLGYIADSNGYDKANPASTGVGVRVTGDEALLMGRAFDKNEGKRGIRQTVAVVPRETTAALPM